MARSTTSVRLDDELRQRLGDAAAAENTTITELIERFVREGLASTGHPGVVFKDGRTGRRAALAGGPDVWEIAAALRHVKGREAKRVATLAEQFGLHERQIVIALDYAAAHREEIENRIQANDRALAEAERIATERAALCLKFLLDAMLPPSAAELLEALGHDATTPQDLGAQNLPDDVLVQLARAADRVIVTENAADFATVGDCAVLFVRKSWWPAGSLASNLASALDRWAKANPEPGPWSHCLAAVFR